MYLLLNRFIVFIKNETKRKNDFIIHILKFGLSNIIS